MWDYNRLVDLGCRGKEPSAVFGTSFEGIGEVAGEF